MSMFGIHLQTYSAWILKVHKWDLVKEDLSGLVGFQLSGRTCAVLALV
jgi:hypothetical protein